MPVWLRLRRVGLFLMGVPNVFAEPMVGCDARLLFCVEVNINQVPILFIRRENEFRIDTPISWPVVNFFPTWSRQSKQIEKKNGENAFTARACSIVNWLFYAGR